MAALGLLAACGGAPAGLNDPRAAELLAMPEPAFLAHRMVSLDLSNACRDYDWNAALDVALNVTRARGAPEGLTPAALSEAARVEEDVLRRSLRARYGGAGACDVLEGESRRRSALSVMVERV